jgi:hypothetical protein
MHISRKTFILTKVFISYTTAMTGRAVTGHGRSLLYNMSLNETTAYRVRLANMTVTTGSMAACTMVTKHGLQGSMIFGHRSHIYCCPIPFLGRMQAILK